uniref:Signal peptidase complex subunit 2 n=1 Tax=Panagrolaimus superbus TaxID=310955 RepID=A0A914Y2E3_9BILA
MILAVCAASYFVLMGILQLYLWYIEKSIFYQAIEKDGKAKDRYWKWSSDMKRFDDKYTLTASYSQGDSFGKVSMSKSMGQYISEDGLILLPSLKAEIHELYNRALKNAQKTK